jgi:hypothetical protein
MEFTTMESSAIQAKTIEAEKIAAEELNDLQLALVGGGNAGVIIA